MKIRTSLLAVIASVVLLGCTTPPGRDRPSGPTGEQPLALGKPAPKMREESQFSQFFLGKPAPFTAGGQICGSPGCTVLVYVDDNCNVTVVYPVLNLGGTLPSPRIISWIIIDNYRDHVFPPLGSNPPALVIDKSGTNDPAFGIPNIAGQTMFLKFTNNYPRLSHEYGLNVKNATTGVMCPTYDPWVIE
jgi:hypothetical protein